MIFVVEIRISVMISIVCVFFSAEEFFNNIHFALYQYIIAEYNAGKHTMEHKKQNKIKKTITVYSVLLCNSHQ